MVLGYSLILLPTTELEVISHSQLPGHKLDQQTTNLPVFSKTVKCRNLITLYENIATFRLRKTNTHASKELLNWTSIIYSLPPKRIYYGEADWWRTNSTYQHIRKLYRKYYFICAWNESQNMTQNESRLQHRLNCFHPNQALIIIRLWDSWTAITTTAQLFQSTVSNFSFINKLIMQSTNFLVQTE